MKRELIFVLALGPALVAHACSGHAQQPQPQQPPPVPVTIEPAELEKLLDYLVRQPMATVEPVVQFLRQKENEAQRVEAQRQMAEAQKRQSAAANNPPMGGASAPKKDE